MRDVMIDLETLGNTPQTPVVSLGATFFCPDTKQKGPTFYMVLNTKEQISDGRKPDQSTLDWWARQSPEARAVFDQPTKPTVEVLETFTAWFKANRGKYVWGNGSTFDISILEDMYRMYNLKCPWLFYNVMDLRTFKRFVANGEKLVKSGVNHNALDDAVSQTDYVLSHL